MRRRFWISTALALPLVLVAMGRHFLPVRFEFVAASATSTMRAATQGVRQRPSDDLAEPVAGHEDAGNGRGFGR